ncbi:hypothetical protein HZB93_04705 [Candidatus Falkowbacteria bacterium]|nr:hypothetical protein [Candidatus Falkowbacteria bacterium]
MDNILALILIFGIPILIISAVESKHRWARFLGTTVVGLIATALSSIVAILSVGLIIALVFGVIMWFFPDAELWEDILMPVLGLFFWVFIYIVVVFIRAWLEERKKKQNKETKIN